MDFVPPRDPEELLGPCLVEVFLVFGCAVMGLSVSVGGGIAAEFTACESYWSLEISAFARFCLSGLS